MSCRYLEAGSQALCALKHWHSLFGQEENDGEHRSRRRTNAPTVTGPAHVGIQRERGGACGGRLAGAHGAAVSGRERELRPAVGGEMRTSNSKRTAHRRPRNECKHARSLHHWPWEGKSAGSRKSTVEQATSYLAAAHCATPELSAASSACLDRRYLLRFRVPTSKKRFFLCLKGTREAISR